MAAFSSPYYVGQHQAEAVYAGKGDLTQQGHSGQYGQWAAHE